ncbi:MAG: T9SS type A sorting domain-containing protein, partial [Fimbriimonadaceae bacterium]|nr:T9SS type A sorting domain-containing protein [Chitinophagales bacterium]
FGNLNRLINGGDNLFADITEQDTTFPAYDVAYDTDIFPAPFLIDIDNDGKKDMIVSPNKEGISENFKNVAYYKNISADETYEFSFQQDSLFVSDMVDVGEGSRAVFFDHNADGLMDIVIGNNGYYNDGDFITALALYENTGTASDPVYTLITRDYANISIFGFQNIAPAFADLDGDGDEDMLFGELNGFLQFFENKADAGEPADFPTLSANYKGIDIGLKSTPQIIDVNEDGLVDLIIGEQNGNLNYYENTGASTAPAFTLINGLWGDVDVRSIGSTTGNSVPHLMKDDTGNWQLFVGCEEGTIFLYEPTPDFTGTFTKITNTFSNIDEGSFSSVYFQDITEDGSPELLTGNYRGGITLYREEGTFDAIIDTDINSNINIYPNPVGDLLKYNIYPESIFESAQIFDITGKLIIEIKLDAFKTIYVSHINPGLYFIRFSNNATVSEVKKFIKQ